MHKVVVGRLGDKDLTFCQFTDMEELKKANLPEGVHYFWEYNNERIYDAGKVVTMIVEQAQQGQLQTNTFLSSRNMKEHYNRLFDAQRKMVAEQMSKLRADVLRTTGVPKEVMTEAVRNLDDTKKLFEEKSMFPDIDGIFRPSRAVAEKLVGGKDNLKKMLTKEQMMRLFGETV